MKSNARSFNELLEYCSNLPLMDCHDHSTECGPKYEDPINALVQHYFRSDLVSAS